MLQCSIDLLADAIMAGRAGQWVRTLHGYIVPRALTVGYLKLMSLLSLTLPHGSACRLPS